MLKLAREIAKRIRTKSIERTRLASRQGRTLRCESLERREVFAVGVSINSAPAEGTGPSLRIDGTAGNDTVIVYWQKNDSSDQVDDQIVVRDQSGLVGRYDVWTRDIGSVGRWYRNFRTIEFHGGKGDDSFRFNGDTPMVALASMLTGHSSNFLVPMSVLAFGDDGNDFLEGGNGQDILHGGAGNDQLIGHASASDFVDRLFGEEGNDTLFGDEVPKASSTTYPDYNKTLPKTTVGYNDLDELFGGDGDDLLIAGIASGSIPKPDAVDLLVGGGGNDTLEASRSLMYGDFTPEQLQNVPSLLAKSGNDYLLAHNRAEMHGGSGNDTITGSDFSDLIYGEDGNDNIDAKGNVDFVISRKANVVYGGNGNDVIKGGDGVDTLYGEAGIDTLYGGKGSDSLYGGTENDKIFGGDDDDVLYGGLGDDEMFGGLGNDFLDGNSGNDYMWGDSGNDIMFGGDGHDQMFGASGDDSLVGGEGNDTLRGGNGDDKLLGQDGQDTLFGEDGDDELDGGIDIYWDTLIGGKGKDKFKADLMGLGSNIKNRDKGVDFSSTEGDQYV